MSVSSELPGRTMSRPPMTPARKPLVEDAESCAIAGAENRVAAAIAVAARRVVRMGYSLIILARASAGPRHNLGQESEVALTSDKRRRLWHLRNRRSGCPARPKGQAGVLVAYHSFPLAERN